MNKKTIAYILIGVAAVAGLWYLYTRYGKGSAGSLGAGMPDNRGSWGADDDAVYNQMRGKFDAVDHGALGWIDPAVKARYEGTDGQSDKQRKIKGVPSKAGAFLSIFEAANPNETGKYTNSAGQKMLWPESLHGELWNMYNNLQIKYGAL